MVWITAAFIFREKAYPVEFDCCFKTLMTIVREAGFSALMNVLEILKNLIRTRVVRLTVHRDMKSWHSRGPSDGLGLITDRGTKWRIRSARLSSAGI